MTVPTHQSPVGGYLPVQSPQAPPPGHQVVPPGGQQGGVAQGMQGLNPNPHQAGGGAGNLAPRTNLLSKLKHVAQNPYEHGLGVSQYTVAALPALYSKTESAKPKMQSTVVQASAIGQPNHPTLANAITATQHLGAPGGPAAPARPPRMQSQAINRLSAQNSLNAVVQRFNGTHAERAALLAELQQVRQASNLTQAQAAQLGKSLRLGFQNAAQAQAALHALTQVNLKSDMVNAGAAAASAAAAAAPGVAVPTPAASAATQDAWKLAANLASVKGVGVSLLEKITQWPAGHQLQARTPQERTADRAVIRGYLSAARLVASPVDGRVDPAAIYHRGGVQRAIRAAQAQGAPAPWPGRNGTAAIGGLEVAEKALLAIRDKADPAIAQRNGLTFAINMVRGGMPTDHGTNADGTESEFHKVESRAFKSFGPHIDRAMRRPAATRMAAAAQAVTHKGKTPISSYGLLAQQSNGPGFSLSHSNSIHQGEAMVAMMNQIETALSLQGGANNQPLPAPGSQSEDPAALTDGTLDNMARRAVLQAVKNRMVMVPRHTHSNPPTQQMRDEARAAVVSLMQPGTVDAAADLRIAQAIQRQVVNLTPQQLLGWAGAIGGPVNQAALMALPPQGAVPAGQPNWSAFRQAFDLAANGVVPPLDTLSLSGRSRPEVGSALADKVRGERLGSGFLLASGGITHFTLKNVSEIVTGVLSGSAGTLRLDLGGGMERIVLFESGVGTDRSFVRVSVATVKQGQAGLGGSGGIDLGLDGATKLSFSLGGDVQQSMEVVHQEGAVFGFPRHLTGGVGGDAALSERKAQLVELLVNVAGGGNGVPGSTLSRPGNAEDQGSLVKAALQAFDDISVGRFQIGQTEHRTTGSVSAGLGVKVDPVNLGVGIPNVRLSGQRKSTDMKYEDLSGWFKAVRTYDTKLYKASLDVTAANFSLMFDHGGEAAAQALAEGAGEGAGALTQILFGGVGAASIDFGKCGQTDAIHRLMEDDEQLPTSFATTSHHNAGSFVNAVAQNPGDFHNFAEDMSRKYHPVRHGLDPQGSIAIEKQFMAQHVTTAVQRKDMTAIFQQYSEWTGRNDDINLIESEQDLATRLNGTGDRTNAQQARQEIDALHLNPGDREGRFLITQNVMHVSEQAGVNGVVGATRASKARASVSSLAFV